VLSSNGQIIFNRTLDLEGQPENILLEAQWEADPSLWLSGDVSVEGAPDADTSPGDNRAYFSLGPVVEGEVALLAQSQYLHVALSPDVMRGQWATRILDPARLADEVAADDAEVLVIESRYLRSAGARKLVKRYLENGRGVLLLVNKVSLIIDGALRDLGFELADRADGSDSQAVRIQYVFASHPVFHPFASPDYGDLTEIKVLQHTRLKAIQGMPLIFSETGNPLFFESTRHAGKLYVSSFGFDRAETTWPVHLTFLPFLDLCLQNARPQDSTPSIHQPGEMAAISLPANTAVREAVLRDGDRELQRAPVDNGGAQIRMPGRPGLYSLVYDDDTEPAKIFSVNPSQKESRLSALDAPAILKTWQLDSATESGGALAGHRVTLSQSAILRQQIWWSLLVVGTGALIIETIWTAMRRKRL
jgi:hypothetical protein